MKGFSLVELSIVLVILGLLTGGILAGQNLIRAAELRSIPTQFQGYQAAVQTFRDKYFALPGDMRNATAFWGDQATGTGSCADATVADGTPGTCNGNGNGLMDVSTEYYRFWQQLALAGLIEGSYTGVNGGDVANFDADARVNVPAGRISNSFWTTRSFGGGATNNFWFAHDFGNNMQLSTKDTDGHTSGGKILSPEDTWNIDTKMDDGMPGRGGVIASFQVDCSTNATGGTDLNADYDLSLTSIECSPVFLKPY